jgi:hypothetical protein
VIEEAQYENALALNSLLLEYRLESVLGAGGFGMTYLGWDSHLEKHVAIKEYLPSDIAVRALDSSVVPVNTESQFNYKWCLDRFIQEARTLARFSHPNIVRVNRFFEANGTSYMVMDYEAGRIAARPLETRAHARRDFAQKDHDAHTRWTGGDIPGRVFAPGHQAIECVSARKRHATADRLRFGTHCHRRDFAKSAFDRFAWICAARAIHARWQPGSWSDIYALSGVLYHAVTGGHPPDAVKRMKDDQVPVALAAARTRYDERFLRAINWGLKLNEKVRPRSIAEWRELFSGRANVGAQSRRRRGNSVDRQGAVRRPAGASSRRSQVWALAVAASWRVLSSGRGGTCVFVDSARRRARYPESGRAAGSTQWQGGRREAARSCGGRTRRIVCAANGSFAAKCSPANRRASRTPAPHLP